MITAYDSNSPIVSLRQFVQLGGLCTIQYTKNHFYTLIKGPKNNCITIYVGLVNLLLINDRKHRLI